MNKISYYGIINRLNISVFITRQYQILDDARNELFSVVKKMMDEPETELIVLEDTAIIYFETDGNLFVAERIDLIEMLNSED